MKPVSPENEAPIEYALSLKQPWAALLIHGLKSIEVRRWPTARRGRVLIHAARIPDPREEGWRLVPAHLQHDAKLVGGIIGAADLTDCLAYRDPKTFANDQPHHLNEPAWYEPPVLYGFRFRGMTVLPFRSYPGWMRFFPVLDKFARKTASRSRE
jgi:hypothetical protein